MTIWDAIGFAAAALILLTFYQKRMIPLRLAALISNVAPALCIVSLRGLPPGQPPIAQADDANPLANSSLPTYRHLIPSTCAAPSPQAKSP